MNFKLLWLCCCVAFALNVQAQQSRITLKVSSQPVSFVINQLSTDYGLQFAYSTSQVNLNRLVSADIRNASPEQALKKLLEGTGIGFTLNGKNVVLYPTLDYKITISGYLREKGTGELLIGAVISTEPLRAGATTNAYGFYSITLPADTYQISYQYTGYKSVSVNLTGLESKQVNIELEPSTNLNEVVISSLADDNPFKLNNIQVPVHEIKSVPMILGERDVVKYIMLSPGVQKGNEGNAYMYVRGGGPDQNLVMIDDAVIYNAYHFLGLASLFSGSELRRADLIKGGFSARYGGRLSSVLDMSMKDGNRERVSADATIGVISSRLMVEAPVIKNKASFLISARKSYIAKVSQWITDKPDDEGSFLNYGFYDIHAKLSGDIGRKDRLMLSGYLGKDIFRIGNDLPVEENGITWGNKAASLRWNHEFNNKLFLNTSLVHSAYRTRFSLGESGTYNNDPYKSIFAIESSIQDYTLKTDLDYMPSIQHKFKAGAGATRHSFHQLSSLSQVNPDSLIVHTDDFGTNEWFAYGEWTWHPLQRIKIISGLRYSYYRNTVTYNRLEPRVSIGYSTPTNWSFLASYSLMNQYLHLVGAFSGIGLPNDMWVSTDEYLKPQRSQLFTLGVSKAQLFNWDLTVNIEAYHKDLENTVSMRAGSSFYSILFLQHSEAANNWSGLVTQGNGWSDGIEFFIKKEHKRFDVRLSYTLSKTTLHFDELNNGRSFPATYDRRHDAGVFLSYKSKQHFQFSASWVYGTGNAMTLPVGEYIAYTHATDNSGLTGQTRYDYEKKNGYRMKPYHRLDISVQYIHTIFKVVESTLEFSIYNVYNQANPFTYEITYEGGDQNKRSLQLVSLFPIIPALSWSIKF
jgi:hypothetical protein